ncbi:pro-neuregulin-4, membrane-bound isoform [Fundulus diaphanus]
MMAEHRKPCDPKDATYCMNGGACYTVPSMDHFSCSCPENYKGSRCEEYQLQSHSLYDPDKGLVAVVVILAILILVVLAVVIYYLHKMLKEGKLNRQNRGQGYDMEKSAI